MFQALQSSGLLEASYSPQREKKNEITLLH
jgi:hypothetical protein